MLLHIIADYGAGDLAFAEVIQRLKQALPDCEIVLTNVPPFSTLAAGFCIAQLGLNAAEGGALIYHNVAPRAEDTPNSGAATEGRLAYARLPNDVRVVGVHAGHCLSFIRDVAAELRWVSLAPSRSQFRSRDVFPDAVAALAANNTSVLAGNIPISEIPDVPANCVAYIDGYGNIKTTIPLQVSVTPGGSISQAHFDDIPGHIISVRIGQVKKRVVVSDGSFDVQSGQIVFSPGSSGWTYRQAEVRREIRWMELFFRSGSAWEEFGRPAVGAEIEILESS
jgi:hypothetical protein